MTMLPSHFLAGAAIYTLAHLVAAPIDSLLAVATVALSIQAFNSAQNRKATGHYLSGPHSVEGLDALAMLSGGLLCFLPTLR